MNEVRSLARQTLIYGFGTIVPRFLNYGIMTFLYTRIFNQAEYGIITELYAWMVLLLIILTYGMETGFFRFSQNDDEYEKVYSTSIISLFITSLLFIVLVFIFISPVSNILNYPDNHDYIKMFAVIVAVDAFCAIPFARLRKDNKPALFSIIKVANVIVTVSVVVFLLIIAPDLYEKGNRLAVKYYNPNYGVGYVFLANVTGSLFTLLLLLPQIINVRLTFVKEIWIKITSYSFPLLIAGLSGSVNDTLDKVIMRRILGEDDGLATVGVYGAGYKIAVLMALFIQMFRFAAEPFFFERARRSGAKEIYAFVMKYFVIAMLVLYLVLNLYLSGFQYINGQLFREAINVVPVVSMGYLLYGIYLNHSIWYKLNDMTIFGVYITLIGAFITVLINVILIPVYGYMASAWAHVACYSVMLIMSYIFAEKRYKINYGMYRLVPYFTIALILIVGLKLIQFNNLVAELVTATVMLIGFLFYAERKDKALSTIIGINRKPEQ